LGFYFHNPGRGKKRNPFPGGAKKLVGFCTQKKNGGGGDEPKDPHKKGDRVGNPEK